MKKLFKNDKNHGITLIALVITIVVLLILAGVTITMVLGENGIIAQAKLAAEKTKQSAEEDQRKYQDLLSDIDTLMSNLVVNGSYDGKVNTPKLGSGMRAVYWNENANDGKGAWETPTTNEQWYNYTDTTNAQKTSRWANAMTSDGSMWVWIPRYAYRIINNYHTNAISGGEIDIKFLQGTENTDGNNTDIVASLDTIVQSGNSGPSTVQNQYVVHPAFKWGEIELSGIWVAKFEASHYDATATNEGTNNRLSVKPNVTSWKNIAINDVFEVCKKYNTELQSHLMKNSEWGAVAYLAHSKYGVNGQDIGVNMCKDFIAGAGPGDDSTPYSYSDSSDEINNFEAKYGYKSEKGKNASTTGNIYGVYDMSGGLWEIVAAYVDNNNDNLKTYGESLKTAGDSSNGNKKYVDVYEEVDSRDDVISYYTKNPNKYGDAVYETSTLLGSSWCSGYGGIPYNDVMFFAHGGSCGSGVHAGLFCFSNGSGQPTDNVGFRPVLVAL